MKKTNQLVSAPSQEVANALAQGFPQDLGFTRINLPRLAMVSQDKTSGRGKSMVVEQEAGTFLKEYQTEELGDNGKPLWAKDEIGSEIEGTIVFQRRQLKYYDSATEKFTSSTIYDSNDDIIPLFSSGEEVARGTAVELKAKYEFVDSKDGKTKSKLEDNKVLYVLYDGELHQMALRGSSMYACKTFLKSVPNPTIFLTKFSSEAKSKGTIDWNQMTFVNVRSLDSKEAQIVLEKQTELREGVAQEKAYFAGQQSSPAMPTKYEVGKLMLDAVE